MYVFDKDHFHPRISLHQSLILERTEKKTHEKKKNHFFPQACILMNNIQQLRVQLEKMFESMGGDKLEEDAANILKELQQQLNGALDDLAMLFANSLEPRITVSVRELGDLLLAIKGGGQVTLSQPAQRNNVTAEADDVLRPLMVLLDGSLSLYAESCEKTVLKRLLKELWKIVMRILEKTVVLPPMTDKSVRLIADRNQGQGGRGV